MRLSDCKRWGRIPARLGTLLALVLALAGCGKGVIGGPALFVDPEMAGTWAAPDISFVVGHSSHGLVHAVAFSERVTATDGGGLSVTDSVRITIENRPPDVPTIIQPEAGATLVATGPVILEGKAFDREDGMLDGAALAWASRLAGDPAFVPRGTGRRVETVFAEHGTYTLRLTASDSLGAQRSAERSITVQPSTGNTPPQVAITVPDQLSVRGEVAAALVTGDVEFVGTAAYLEDAASVLQLLWRAEPLQPAGPAFEFGPNSTVATASLPAVGGQDTRYRITFRATDTGLLTSSTSIQLLILASPIL